MTTDTEMSLWFERFGNPARGLIDGQAGAHPAVHHQSRHPGDPRTNRMSLREGDVVRCYTGGYGNPRHCDPQAVLDDLADGHISPDYARRHHRLSPQDLTRG